MCDIQKIEGCNLDFEKYLTDIGFEIIYDNCLTHKYCYGRNEIANDIYWIYYQLLEMNDITHETNIIWYKHIVFSKKKMQYGVKILATKSINVGLVFNSNGIMSRENILS